MAALHIVGFRVETGRFHEMLQFDCVHLPYTCPPNARQDFPQIIQTSQNTLAGSLLNGDINISQDGESELIWISLKGFFCISLHNPALFAGGLIVQTN